MIYQFVRDNWQTIEERAMRTSPNVIITGTPGVGKTVHCEQLAQETGLKHLSINKVAKERECHDGYDEKLKSYIVDEDKVRSTGRTCTSAFLQISFCEIGKRGTGLTSSDFGAQLLDELEEFVPKGGYLIDWHACDLFPKSWVDLVVVLRCPATSVLYDRLSSRYVSGLIFFVGSISFS